MRSKQLQRVPAVERLEQRLNFASFDFDSRIQVPDRMLDNPVDSLGNIAAFSGIGQVITDRNGDRDFTGNDTAGTAFLVRPNYAMTAAHVVYFRNENGQLLASQASQMFIRFGWNGSEAFGGFAGVKRIIYPTEWKNFVDSSPAHRNGLITESATLFDYAFLELDQNVKSNTLVSFYPVPATTSTLVNQSFDTDSAPTGTHQLFVSGYPGDSPWSNRHYPQVISTGPAHFTSLGAIKSEPRDYSIPNPWSTLIPRFNGESTSAYNARTQQFRLTSGLDSYHGMSGGPLWVWNDGSSGRQEYQFVGLVSNSGSSGNVYTPVTNRMVSDFNLVTGMSGSGIHFATAPAEAIEDRAIIASYDELFDTQHDFAPTGVVGLLTDDGNALQNNSFLIKFTPYNRGQLRAESVVVDFFASLDETLDPATDILLRSYSFANGVSSQASGNLDSLVRLFVPTDFPHLTNFHLGWIIRTNADPGADRGFYPGTFSVDWAPTIRVKRALTFTPGFADTTGGDYIYIGETSTPIQVVVSDPGGNDNTIELHAYAISDTARTQPLSWVQFSGSGANRSMTLTPPVGFPETTIVLIATDEMGTTNGVYIPLTPPPTNYPPLVAPIDDVTLKVGETYSHQIEATDREGTTLTYEPRWWGVDKITGLIQFTATEDQVGQLIWIVVSATDSGSPPARSSRLFNVTVVEANELPIMVEVDTWLKKNRHVCERLEDDNKTEGQRRDLIDAIRTHAAHTHYFGKIVLSATEWAKGAFGEWR